MSVRYWRRLLVVGASLSVLVFGAGGTTRVGAQAPAPELDVVDVVSQGREVAVTIIAPPGLRNAAVTADSFEVSIDGKPVVSWIEPIAGDELDVVLLVDISGSMTAEALGAAKASGAAFATQLPSQTRVAVVSFGDTATLVQPFTTNVAEVVAQLNSLEASGDTALHAAVVEAARLFDPTSESLRTVVLLSDGGNTVDESSLGSAQAAIALSNATLYAISITTDEANEAELELLADAGGGSVARVEQVAEMEALYRSIAEDLGNQYRVRFFIDGEGQQLATVSAQANGVAVAENAVLVTVPETAPAPSVAAPPAAPPVVLPPADRVVSPPRIGTFEAPARSGLKWLSIGALATAVAIAVMLVLTPGDGRRRPLKPADRFVRHTPRSEQPRGLRQVVDRLTTKVDTSLSSRRAGPWVSGLLDTAGWKVRNSEFVLLSSLLACLAFFAGAIRSLALGAVFTVLVVAFIGLALMFKVKRRRSAFAHQLNGTLQMMAGGLRTGYSMQQVISLVAQEADVPTSEEFSRMTVEMRLGRDLVEAAQGVGARMQSSDFLWTTGAIEIARDVGGDLAEVIDNVAATVRTRDRVRRQIQALSAEGRISAWILIALPFPIFFWQLVVNRSYTMLLVTDSMGRIIFITGLSLLVIGALWLRSQIRIEY